MTKLRELKFKHAEGVQGNIGNANNSIVTSNTMADENTGETSSL